MLAGGQRQQHSTLQLRATFWEALVTLTDTPVPLRFGSTQRSKQEERSQGIPGNSYVVE